jgi:hypothetical protein
MLLAEGYLVTFTQNDENTYEVDYVKNLYIKVRDVGIGGSLSSYRIHEINRTIR